MSSPGVAARPKRRPGVAETWEQAPAVQRSGCAQGLRQAVELLGNHEVLVVEQTPHAGMTRFRISFEHGAVARRTPLKLPQGARWS